MFELLIPNVDAKKAADWPLSTAVKLLSKAADAPVEGRLGGEDAFESVREVVAGGSDDEIIISTLPKGRSERLQKDLPTRVETLGVPVMVITPPREPSAIKAFADSFSAKAPPTTGYPAALRPVPPLPPFLSPHIPSRSGAAPAVATSSPRRRRCGSRPAVGREHLQLGPEVGVRDEAEAHEVA